MSNVVRDPEVFRELMNKYPALSLFVVDFHQQFICDFYYVDEEHYPHIVYICTAGLDTYLDYVRSNLFDHCRHRFEPFTDFWRQYAFPDLMDVYAAGFR